jgi:hypothetical protein
MLILRILLLVGDALSDVYFTDYDYEEYVAICNL